MMQSAKPSLRLNLNMEFGSRYDKKKTTTTFLQAAAILFCIISYEDDTIMRKRHEHFIK